MLLEKCLIFSSAVLQAQLLLYQTPRFQFVDIRVTAQIACTSPENYYDEGTSIVWYKARENELPLLIKSCSDDSNEDKFVCKINGETLVLEILRVQVKDSGVYLCAKKKFGSLIFSNGSSLLIVGDSYTLSTRVMLLFPPPRLTQAAHVACMVHGVSNLVQVSWDTPMEPQAEGLTLMVRMRRGLFTFASVLRIPTDSQLGGKNFTCEVRFNSSAHSVKEVAAFPTPPAADPDGKCLRYMVPTVVVGLLALLTLILSLLWILLCPSKLGFQSSVPEPLSPEISQEGLCYSQLDFPSRTSDNGQRNGASRGRKLKM